VSERKLGGTRLTGTSRGGGGVSAGDSKYEKIYGIREKLTYQTFGAPVMAGDVSRLVEEA